MSGRTVIITNLSPELDDEFIRDFVGRCGTHERFEIESDGTSKGCVVVFSTPEMAAACLLHNGAALRGNVVSVVLADESGSSSMDTSGGAGSASAPPPLSLDGSAAPTVAMEPADPLVVVMPFLGTDLSASPPLGPSAAPGTPSSARRLAKREAKARARSPEKDDSMESDSPIRIVSNDLPEQLSAMFRNRMYTDLKIVVGPNRHVVPAHRCVVTYFSAYFKDHPAITSDPEAGEVVVELPTDVDYLTPENVSMILALMYAGQVKIPAENRPLLADLIATAAFLRAETVREALISTAFSDRENVIALFGKLASKASFDPHLLESCAKFFQEGEENCELLTERPDLIRDASPEVLRTILENDKLPMTEIDVFKICLNWARNQVVKKPGLTLSEAISPLRSCARLNMLSFQQLRTHIVSSGVFSKPEILDLYKNAQKKDDTQIRYVDGSKQFECWRSTRVKEGSLEGGWSYGSSPDRVDFTVSHPIMVLGVGYFVGSGSETTTDLAIQLSGTSLTRKNVSVNPAERCVHRVMFDTPVRIRPEVRYTLHMHQRGPSSPCIRDGTDSVTVSDVRFKFFNHSGGSGNGTDARSGQFPLIIFRKTRTFD